MESDGGGQDVYHHCTEFVQCTKAFRTLWEVSFFQGLSIQSFRPACFTLYSTFLLQKPFLVKLRHLPLVRLLWANLLKYRPCIPYEAGESRSIVKIFRFWPFDASFACDMAFASGRLFCGLNWP